MSMITELIDRLRMNTNWLDEDDNDERAIRKSMLEAADTIQLLSEKLHASQIERSSQYYNDGWISVEDRLPKDEYVLISKKPMEILGDKWSVDIAMRTADQRSGKIQWRDREFGVIPDDKVLAWMSLPMPYQPKDGE